MGENNIISHNIPGFGGGGDQDENIFTEAAEIESL